MAFERGGRLSDRASRFLARRGGRLWSAHELRVGWVEAIEPLERRLTALRAWAAHAPTPWLSELDFEPAGHLFTVFDQSQGMVLLGSPPLSLGARAWLVQTLQTLRTTGFEPELRMDQIELLIDQGGQLRVRPVVHEEPEWDDDGRPAASLPAWLDDEPAAHADRLAFEAEVRLALEGPLEDARRGLQVAMTLLDGGDPESLPGELVAGILERRDSDQAWAVAQDWLLGQRLPRGELMLLEQTHASEPERAALLERFPELSPGSLPAGVSLEWRHGYVAAIELVPMVFAQLRALLRHPSCRFVQTLRLRAPHFVDAVELLGDLRVIGHAAVEVIDAPASVLRSEIIGLRQAFPRLRDAGYETTILSGR